MSDDFFDVASIIEQTAANHATELDLSWRGLSELPESIASLTQITELYLQNNKLSELPEFIGLLINLRRLEVYGNKLLRLPNSIGRLTQLRTLRIERNQLSGLPETIGGLTELQCISLTDNTLSNLTESIGGLTSLCELNLSNQRLTTLPESLGQLTQLSSLDLSRNRIAALPESIGQLAQLKKLKAINNQITALPDSIGELKQLDNLDLSANHLIGLPDSIGQLTQLQRLDVSSNQLSSLPESICNLSRLQTLNVAKNVLLSLPHFIGQLGRLTQLYISDNHLTSLPESVGLLTDFRGLDLSNNRLGTLPESIGRLVQLESLILAGNKLRELPDFVGRIRKLTRLDLSSNQLTTLPSSVGNLGLHELRLDDNQFSSVPESVSRLTQLQILSLSDNRLTDLTDFGSSLIKLRELSLNDNQLATLPDSLRHLRALKTLEIHGNDDLGLPPEVLGPRPDANHRTTSERASAILEYYFRLRAGRRSLNEAKLILVGRGGVGKTSIVNRLVHSQFMDERKTEGIKITEWKIRIKKEEVRLNIWDFGGQEIMHATHQFFLTQRSLYLLVINGREGGEDADAEYWLKLIDSFGGDSSVIVVLNKIKEHPFDLNRRALQQKYSIRTFIETDCEDGTGIKELRNVIARETDLLADLRKAFPAGWFTIKDQLAAMKENYLSFEDYRRICERHGEMDCKAQEDLAGFLHRLGIALNYKDDPRLQDTHVLNPHWVTNAIYRVLNSLKLQKQKGEIRLNDLAGILDANEYPANMRRFIFDLMKKFELCLSFPEDDTRYLIPELLDKQQPSEADDFNPEESLTFQYDYSVLPEGLLPRFIVRSHVLSEGLCRWRTGAILEFEGCRALVKADVQDKRVFINVTGPLASRRRLLAVIRSDFERIHRDIRNLHPSEMVPIPNYPSVAIPYEKLLAMERERINTFPEYAAGKVIQIDVQELLNGVDLEQSRSGENAADQKTTIRLFYSYSHRDETLRNELETHLKLLQRQGTIEPWHDSKIDAGEEWKREIDQNLETADIILLLVSADFIASDYCYEKEMKRALERHVNGAAQVIPVIVRDVNWSKAPFARLQALPKGGKAVELWQHRDSAWRSVAEGIERAVMLIGKPSRR